MSTSRCLLQFIWPQYTNLVLFLAHARHQLFCYLLFLNQVVGPVRCSENHTVLVKLGLIEGTCTFVPLVVQAELMGRQPNTEHWAVPPAMAPRQTSELPENGIIGFSVELSRKETFLNQSRKVAKAFGGWIRKLRALWTLLLHLFPPTRWLHSGACLLAAHLLFSTEWWFAVSVYLKVSFFLFFLMEILLFHKHKLREASEDSLKCFQKSCSAVAWATQGSTYNSAEHFRLTLTCR